jgi:hypothetical protein
MRSLRTISTVLLWKQLWRRSDVPGMATSTSSIETRPYDRIEMLEVGGWTARLGLEEALRAARSFKR